MKCEILLVAMPIRKDQGRSYIIVMDKLEMRRMDLD